METIIGDYIGTIIGIHSPILYKAPDRYTLNPDPTQRAPKTLN